MSTSTNISCGSTRVPDSVDVLYTDIGRGHPFYLDGIVDALPPEARGDVTTVFDATSGIPRRIWQLGKAAYRLGSSAGGQNSLYTRLRRAGDYNTPGPLLRWAGAPLERRFAERIGPLVVAHPILVALLRKHPRLVYQHGELVVPPECLVIGRHTLLVPTLQAADVFIAAGFAHQNLVVTGLCVESTLAAAGATMQNHRQQRYGRAGSLTGGYFSSGAEPTRHVATLIAAALSAVLHGGNALVVARRGGPYARAITNAFARRGLTLSTDPSQVPPAGALLRTYDSRKALNAITCRHFADLDYFVSPAHERTNWAMGLGLPMFIVDPSIGTFAPRNRELLITRGVADTLTSLSEASAFGARLESQWKAGMLERRSEAGWGQYPLDGFQTIAEWLS